MTVWIDNLIFSKRFIFLGLHFLALAYGKGPRSELHPLGYQVLVREEERRTQNGQKEFDQ